MSVKLSDRHFGIGGDGIILICPSEKADFRMRMFNSLDGSEGEMCGNAIRCVGKYVYDNRMTDKNIVSVETLGGIKTLYLNAEGGKVRTVRVDMGKPETAAGKIPVITDKPEFIDMPVTSEGITYNMTCVSMGNPHAVTYVDDVSKVKVGVIGPGLENNTLFPQRANIEFVEIVDNSTIKMRVWERGSGETLACGTGACASAVATHILGKCGRRVKVILLGGELEIFWSEEDGHVYMTGPAETVFEGTINL